MDAMVTGRMPEEKKAAGNAILSRCGLNASQAIGLMYDRLIGEKDAAFLQEKQCTSHVEWPCAAEFVDDLVVRRDSRFHQMSKAEIKCERVQSQRNR